MKDCTAAFNNFRGAYQIFIRRVDQQAGLVYMQGALRVRYIFKTERLVEYPLQAKHPRDRSTPADSRIQKPSCTLSIPWMDERA